MPSVQNRSLTASGTPPSGDSRSTSGGVTSPETQLNSVSSRRASRATCRTWSRLSMRPWSLGARLGLGRRGGLVRALGGRGRPHVGGYRSVLPLLVAHREPAAGGDGEHAQEAEEGREL